MFTFLCIDWKCQNYCRNIDKYEYDELKESSNTTIEEKYIKL